MSDERYRDALRRVRADEGDLDAFTDWMHAAAGAGLLAPPAWKMETRPVMVQLAGKGGLRRHPWLTRDGNTREEREREAKRRRVARSRGVKVKPKPGAGTWWTMSLGGDPRDPNEPGIRLSRKLGEPGRFYLVPCTDRGAVVWDRNRFIAFDTIAEMVEWTRERARAWRVAPEHWERVRAGHTNGGMPFTDWEEDEDGSP